MAAITRTSTRIVCESPMRSNARSCSTRSSFACSAGLIVPTSSSNSVPRWACSKRPWRCATAPVNAPRTWPKSSASSRVSGMALQLSAMKRCWRRGLPGGWRGRPVPCRCRLALHQNRRVRRRDGGSAAAPVRASARCGRPGRRSPYRASSCSPQVARSRRAARRRSSAARSTCSSSSNWKGLVMKSAAPRRMASTASLHRPVARDHDATMMSG